MTTTETSTLTADQLALRDVVRQVTAKYDRAYWLGCAREGRYPDDLWTTMAEVGILGIQVPPEYGGVGLGATEVVIVGEEFHRAGVSLSSWQHLNTCRAAIVNHGSDEQKNLVLPPSTRGKLWMSLCVTEADAGTNTFKIRTLARPTDGGYVLNGQKLFIGGANIANYLVVAARTAEYSPDADKRTAVSVFLVDTSLPGITMTRMELANIDVVGRFAVDFENVELPPSALIGEEGTGLRALFSNLNIERVHNAAQSLGLGYHVLEKVVDYVRERVVFDDPLGAYQAVQHPLARARAQLDAARLMTYHAAALYDAGESAATEAVMAKFLASEAAHFAADSAVQFHGGAGFDRGTDIFDLFTQIRLNRIVPLNNEMALNYIAERALGLPKSY